MGIINKKDEEFFENVEYFSEIIDRINDIQENNNYSDEEMDNDLDVALWRAFVYINLWSYKGYAKAERILKKVENKGIKNPIWCYRYAVSIARLRKYEEALKYFLIGTEVDSTYPWNWLELGRLYYKFGELDKVFECIEKGLELVPNDYEFLTLKDDVKNDRGYFYSINHYINEEVDKTEDRELDYGDDEEWEKFKKETHYGEKCL
ncbi:tetratricopeptide repeat protein [Fusobacterium nucleatum subsp. nucleatum ATCC 23726]|uniref:Tetratricopeptide repeat-containing protein n=2 Tax=Fusobacterium nucleatum subsp. nucleatum TaxID=76856 RepID=Q8RE58_FUSNN|nr:tetratricopeptide repeat protein [Fusobacterium nucleatum]AAL95463.1 Hypothetical protein FN1267 [Fusobacterium nucleatum subsp. nucleatum ATCC 25586]ALF24646.1 hypothetical protein RO05_09800 [Fusobacterium nucleatum subsp. nucleatum ChDC F316]ALF25715.1 hypothetical protein RN95_04390 [Fusobacterium nucleatum subsp. nucleatum]ASG26107.1 tetratricopeptide repeat protein [Fusobacterium nucleatum subsp. nucleatum]AVQ15591.1 tetratricopeptide repeat-containing protein [Fusobacterium nucleatum